MSVVIEGSSGQIIIGAWIVLYAVVLVLSNLVIFSRRLHFRQRMHLFVGLALLIPLTTVVLFLSLGVTCTMVIVSCLVQALFLGVGSWDFCRRRGKAEDVWRNPTGSTRAEVRAMFSFGGVLVVTVFYELCFLAALTAVALLLGMSSLIIQFAWYTGTLVALVLSWRFYKQLQASHWQMER